MRNRDLSAKAMPRHWRLRPLALSLACMGAGMAWGQVIINGGPSPVGGLPQFGNVMAGSVTGSVAGNVMTINQASQRGIVNWQSFSIGQSGHVNVVQPSVASVLLNRVTGGTASVIQGKLTSTLIGSDVPGSGGSVYLINPSGVVFSKGSSVSTGGLIASTLDIAGPDEATRNEAFMAGGKQLILGGDINDANSTARVTVQPGATISVGEGGTVGLIGALVRNEGEINVARGSVGLVSGARVTLDFEGDGLTKFTVPVDGGLMNTSVAVVQADPGGSAEEAELNASTKALVMNTGTITADGGRVVLVGASGVAQQVVNQSGTVRARSLVNRGGEIVLEAIGASVDGAAGLEVGGTLDARGDAAGVKGGEIRTSAGNLSVLEGTKIHAGGGAGGGNGSWTAEGGQNLTIVGDGDTGNIAASVIGKALSQGADVTLTTRSSGTVPQENVGVVFQSGAQVIKDSGGTATLRVNSAGNIEMRQDEGGGAMIASESGALNVEFNADAQGLALAQAGKANSAAAAIRLDGAVIDANGGNIRFFGQGKSDGSAVGGQVKGEEADVAGEVRSGIWLGESTLSTHGSGSISLRGEGGIGSALGSGVLSASDGVSIGNDSTLSTEAGSITLTGRGAAGASGVRVSGDDYSASLSSKSGDIVLNGTVRDWATDDLVGEAAGGAGVSITGAELSTGGSLRISGQGGDLSGMASGLPDLATSLSTAFTVQASHGVLIDGSRLEAGAGRSIEISGTAGSAGFGVDETGAPVTFQPLDLDVTPFAVQVRSQQEADGLHAAGGTITIAAGTGDVRLTAGGYDSPLLDVVSTTGVGGHIGVSGRNILAETAADIPRLADASGQAGGGSIDIHGATAPGAGNEDSGVVAIGSALSLQANALGGTGNGGSIRVVGDRSLRAFGSFEAKGGSAGGNGGTIETSGGSFELGGIQVDASAPAGQAGSWLIDPYNVTIQSGVASGSLPTNPFVPVATSTIQDGDINAALNKGTSVTITTGTGGTDPGNINFDNGVLIERNTGAAPVFFQLDAAGSIGRSFAGTGAAPTIRSTTGPMDVIFNAGTGGGAFNSLSFSGNSAADRATIATQGGNVTMQVAGGTFSNLSAFNTDIDTGGGNLTLQAGTPGAAGTNSTVSLNAAQVATGGGALSMAAYGDGAYVGVGSGTQITTDGGGVSILTGQPGAPAGSVDVTAALIDTRAGQSDAGAGGSVSIASGSVSLSGATIATSTGNVDITATGNPPFGYSGVVIGNKSSITTTSGEVQVRGVVRSNPSSAYAATHGVLVTGGSGIVTGSGSIRLRGAFDADIYDGTDSGVRLENGARLATTGGGDIELTGSATGASTGVSIQAGGAPSLPGAAPQVQSSGDLILRAASGGSTPALVVEAPVSAAGTINLRPGGMDTALNVFDATSSAITVGGAPAAGFAVSDALLSQLNAPTLVVGSNTHAGAITVAAPLTRGGALTLQNEGAGSGGIALNAPVTADRLGLLSAGDITQTAGAPVVAQHLLARSTGGSVLLDRAANNVSENSLAGGAAGAFRYQDVDGVRLGALSVTGFDAASNQPQVVSATSMAADTVFVRTLSGDLTLDMPVSSTSGVDLVAAARFQNPGGGSIGGAPWRIWADTWEGESRGGLSGSGQRPDIFACPYPGPCPVAVSPGDNHFIYARGTNAPDPVVTWRLPPLVGPDLVRELPSTYTYTFDRNIGAAPICFATGPLGGDRAQQGDDLLAREWSRVRSRPNLTSCVDTERKNGCADF
ncbi:beta strand repeat-containing protein [Xenophilus sp.]|uniref:beta strand repeat-containing protein n=1 Tax=Xenophilus sp. TaxID=1873499 RepID=UPI0037DD1ABD